MLLMALVIAVGMKVVGALLIISLLIIPAATARRLAKTPEQMAVAATLAGMVSVLAGLWLSVRFDLPAGPAIVAAGSAGFALVFSLPRRRERT
jgi:zinc transport system permease protein